MCVAEALPAVPRSAALPVRAQRRPPAATACLATTTVTTTTTTTIAAATAALAAVARLQGERGVGDGAAVERARVALEAHGEQLEVRGAPREGAEERADLQPDVARQPYVVQAAP